MIAVSLAACSSGGGGAGEGTAEGEAGEAADSSGKRILDVWVFAEPHQRFFEAVAEPFEASHPDVDVQITLFEGDAMVEKYSIIMQSGGEGAPDLIDIEQGQFPKFIRGDIPFEPLNPFLEADGVKDAIAAGRQALYTVDGNIYGLEHAATVSALYYRKDAFDEAGIDMTQIKTWDEFTEAAKKLVGDGKYVLHQGTPWSSTGVEAIQFEILLRQEGGDIVTTDGGIGINTPEALTALQRIRQWQELGIMDKASPEGPQFWESFTNGTYLATIGPDWWVNLLGDNAPDLSGKWHAVPIPLGGPNSVRTTVWGGTGLMISKFSDAKELAWEFAKFAQLDADNSVKRFQIVNLFPALLSSLDKPGLHEQSKYTEYFGGQDLGQLYGDLLAEAPNQNQAWWRPLWEKAWEEYAFDLFDGNMEPEEFLSKVEAKLQEMIAEEEAKMQ